MSDTNETSGDRDAAAADDLRRQNLAALMEDLDSADVRLEVGPERVPMTAHACILACRSDYFARMLRGGFAEARKGDDAIRLPAERPDVFREVLRHMYSGEPRIEAGMVVALATTADRLLMPDLLQRCIGFADTQMDAGNALRWLSECADARFPPCARAIELACVRWVGRHSREVFASEPWSRCSSGTAIRILSSDALIVASEDEVLDAALAWVRSRERTRVRSPEHGRAEKRKRRNEGSTRARRRVAIRRVVRAKRTSPAKRKARSEPSSPCGSDDERGDSGGDGECADEHPSTKAALALAAAEMEPEFAEVIGCVRLGLASCEALYRRAEPSRLFAAEAIGAAYRCKADPWLTDADGAPAFPSGWRPRVQLIEDHTTIEAPLRTAVALHDAAPGAECLSPELDFALGFRCRIGLCIPEKTTEAAMKFIFRIESVDALWPPTRPSPASGWQVTLPTWQRFCWIYYRTANSDSDLVLFSGRLAGRTIQAGTTISWSIASKLPTEAEAVRAFVRIPDTCRVEPISAAATIAVSAAGLAI